MLNPMQFRIKHKVYVYAEQGDDELLAFYRSRKYLILCLLHSYYAELGQHAYYMEKPL